MFLYRDKKAKKKGKEDNKLMYIRDAECVSSGNLGLEKILAIWWNFAEKYTIL